MKKLFLFLLLPLSAAAAPVNGYTDLQAVSTTFAEELGGLLEAGKLMKPDEVKGQLAPLRRTNLELARPRGRVRASDDIYREGLKSVVQVGRVFKCGKCDHWHESSAGGFIIHEEGYIATNFHVMQGATEKAGEGMGVRLSDGRVVAVKRIVASDKANDLAIIQVDATDLTPLRIADDIDIGDPVFVLSHPEGVFNTFTEGMVSNKVRRPGPPRGKRSVPELNITADFAKGSSGSPVLNNCGELVGMVRSTRSTYYDEKNGVDTNLQMVWKDAIPSFLIRDLCSAKSAEKDATSSTSNDAVRR